MKPKIVFLVGPTAIGKTQLALRLARTKKFEIISCDSMQVYKGFKILSDQPPETLRKRIPYHLVACLLPQKEYNAAKFRKEALRLIKEIHCRGKIPLIVGGSGLYISVLRDGLFETPAKSLTLRRRLKKEAEVRGVAFLHKKLKQADPEAAAKIHPRNLRRVIRALEIYMLTRAPISKWQKSRRPLSEKYDVYTFGLMLERPRLYERIDQRVEAMFKKGVVAEARKILTQRTSKTASYAIGLREIQGWLNGEYDLQEAKRLIKRNSRRFAKRQLSWFGRDSQIEWINTKQLSHKKVAQRILQKL